MKIILDANIILGYYKETVLEIEHSLTDSPSKLFTKEITVLIDTGGKIEHEYTALLDKDWVKNWIIDLIDQNILLTIETENHQPVCAALYKLGFPNSSRDIWYIRTGCTASKSFKTEVYLITEDLDFYNPKSKQCPPNIRQSTLSCFNSPIQKLLEKQDLLVRSVCSC
ncbi:hypothetical protein [Leptospira levettii]|uniref:hypothetical protein n=1 Tax=Leptospira levettii TaxID=2023178 RepID=UPI00223DA4B5|nr:hypothetical protein [Leptospira levettii]MCW7475584.1 hypothetical protein [Leptospira levettii]